MNKKIMDKTKEIWKSNSRFHIKILCIAGLGIGKIIGEIKLFILRKQIKKINKEFEKRKDDWIRILSTHYYYNADVYLKVKQMFFDKVIDNYFDSYINGDMNYKTLKLCVLEVINNFQKIYRETLKEI